MNISVTFQKESGEKLFNQLEKLRFNPKKRFELSRKAAREVRKFTTERARKQQNLDGSAFAPRSEKGRKYRRNKLGQWRKKRRMLENIGKSGNMAVYRLGEAVALGWRKHGKRHRYDVVAYKHHHGMTSETGVTEESKRGLKKWHQKLKSQRPSRAMARALIKAGYRQPVMGKGKKIRLRRVSQKYIIDTLSFFQVAWLLRMLVRGDVSKESPRKQKPQRWQVNIPARNILGVNKEQSEMLLDNTCKEILKALLQG